MMKVITIISYAILYCLLSSGFQVAQAAHFPKPAEQSSNVYKVASQYCHGHRKVTGRTAIASKRSKSEKRARRKWKERVVFLMPWSWGQADWAKAKERGYVCGKKHGTWRCRASAIPCAGWPKR